MSEKIFYRDESPLAILDEYYKLAQVDSGYLTKGYYEVEAKLDKEEKEKMLQAFEIKAISFIKEIKKHISDLDAKRVKKARAEGKAEDEIKVLAVNEVYRKEDFSESPLNWDSSVEFYTSLDGLNAILMVFPEFGKGKKVTGVTIMSAVKSSPITKGINEDILNDLIEKKAWLYPHCFALGKDKEDGLNGTVTELFNRSKKIHLVEDEVSKTVDYKNLNWIQRAEAGQPICTLVQPTLAVDGMTVLGYVIRGTDGKMPKVPAGIGTAINDEKTALVAIDAGQVSCHSNLFKVEQVIQIEGNVDHETGNVEAIGSVIVKGNITTGYTVKASKDVIVKGMIEGAFVDAGGNILVSHGMNGNMKGTLVARGDVSSKFLENCFVTAGGNIKSDIIINSTVSSRETVTVNTGKGIVIGSNITGLKGVVIKQIGNGQCRISNITIGADPNLISEVLVLKDECQSLLQKSKEIEKNIGYIEKIEILTSDYIQLLAKLKFEESICLMNYKKKEKRLSQLLAEMNDVSAQLLANKIVPPVCVSMGNLKHIINQEMLNSRVFKNGGEIVVASR